MKIIQKIVSFPKIYICTKPDVPVKILEVLMAPVETNRTRILDMANEISREMVNIIRVHFFGTSIESNEIADEFQNLILESDWCAFSSKKKLLSSIVNSKKLLKGEEKPKLDELTKKVMSVRNAFAHGQLMTDGKEIWLEYFEGNSIKRTLNDEYFSGVEKDFNDCFSLLQRIAGMINVYKSS